MTKCGPRLQTGHVRCRSRAVYDRGAGYLELSLRERYSNAAEEDEEAGSEIRDEVRSRASCLEGSAQVLLRASTKYLELSLSRSARHL